MPKYTVKKGGEMLRAVAAGFYGARRVTPGETLFAQEGESFSWALPLNAAQTPGIGDSALLEQPVSQIVPKLKGMTDADLRALRDAESRGETPRSTLLNTIDDELSTRLSRGGGIASGNTGSTDELSASPNDQVRRGRAATRGIGGPGDGITEQGGGNDERRFGGGLPGAQPNPDRHLGEHPGGVVGPAPDAPDTVAEDVPADAPQAETSVPARGRRRAVQTEPTPEIDPLS